MIANLSQRRLLLCVSATARLNGAMEELGSNAWIFRSNRFTNILFRIVTLWRLDVARYFHYLIVFYKIFKKAKSSLEEENTHKQVKCKQK